MQTSIKRILMTGVLGFALCTFAHAQYVNNMGTLISMNIVHNNTTDVPSSEHKPHRVPGDIPLNIYFDDDNAMLSLQAESSISFLFSIKNADGEIIHSVELCLDEDEVYTVPTDNLSPGAYTLQVTAETFVLEGIIEW